MTQQKINKAYPALIRLCDLKLPIKTAREVYVLSSTLRQHFEFALAEERKNITTYNGSINQDGSVRFTNPDDFQKYCKCADELNNSEVDWVMQPIIIQIESVGEQRISPADMRDLEGFISFE